MAITKSSTVVHNNITLTAGAGNTTSSDQDLTGSYRQVARVRFTNGATGPTVQAQCQIQVAETSTGDYTTLATVYGGTVNSAISEYEIEVPDATLHMRFVSGSNTGQNVTLRAVLDTITAI